VLSEWNKTWQNSDINDFHKSYVQTLASDNKEYTEVFFGERNKNMAFQIAELLDKKGYTVEVVDVDKLSTENK
jgi:uncharacterized protein YbaP (TraB family)